MLLILYFTIISFVSLLLTFKISSTFNLYDEPNKSKIHKNKIPNVVGLGLLPIVVSIIFINELNDKILITFSYS